MSSVVLPSSANEWRHAAGLSDGGQGGCSLQEENIQGEEREKDYYLRLDWMPRWKGTVIALPALLPREW